MKISNGTKVTVTDPRNGKKASGIVKWVSPTHKTFTAILADGFTTYNFAQEG